MTIVGQAFEFTPAGTTFAEPVQVELDMTDVAGFDSAAANHVVYWSKPGDTTQFEVVPHTREGDIFRFSVSHFSIGFVGVPQQTTVVDPLAAPPLPPKLTVTFRADSARPVWFATRLGNGPWSRQTLPQNSVYQTDLTETRFGVAWVCESTEQDDPKSVHVIYGVQASPDVSAEGCDTYTKEETNVSGTMLLAAAPNGATVGHVLYPDGSTQIGLPQQQSYSFSSRVTQGDFMAIAASRNTPDIYGMVIKRNVMVNQQGLFNVVFDFASEGIDLETRYKLTVPSTAFIYPTTGYNSYNQTGISYRLPGYTAGMSIQAGNFSDADPNNGNKYSVRYIAIPIDKTHADDRYVANARTLHDANGFWCATTHVFKTPKDIELTFIGKPSGINPTGQTVTTHKIMTVVWTPGAGATHHKAAWSQHKDNSVLRYEVMAAGPWFADTTRSMSTPDLSAVEGFKPAWLFSNESAVDLDELTDIKLSTPAANESMEQVCVYSNQSLR